MSANPLKANFAVQNKYGAFFTGGDVKLSKDGQSMFCQCGNTVRVIDVSTGKQTSVIGQEEDDEVTSFGITPDDEFLIVASRGLLLKKWNWRDNVVVKTWKAIHTGPISCMTFDVTSTLLATGGADATIKVWDIVKQYCTHNLTGHSGVVSVVAYHPDISRLQLFSAADDYKIRVWDLQTSSCKMELEGHYSMITAIQFSHDGKVLYSGGRDNVVIVWNVEDFTKTKTIPVYDSVEALVLLPENEDISALNVSSHDPHFMTGGSKGLLKIWDSRSCTCVYPKQQVEEKDAEGSEPSAQAITRASYHKELNCVNVVTYDHNIYLRNLPDLSINKQFVGYNDDVLDMAFYGVGDSHIAVATNSELVKVFEAATWSCQILSGHTDIVLCVAVSVDRMTLASGSKDNTIRLWRMDKETKIVRCVAVGNGHTHAVNSVSFPRMKDAFLVSGSHDCTLKLWTVPGEFIEGQVMSLSSTATEHAHEKEINAVCVTPNDKLIASGSQDRTAKVWSSTSLSLLGVLRGHKRSIWNMQFSPVDQVLATASADATIKIWAISDFSCVKTFEGHQSSVLRVQFVTRGMQLVSSGSDGLLKLWTIKSSECVGTWDEHEEKVWALTVSKDEQSLATGAGDSTICLWKDVTEEEERESVRKQEEFILQEQRLSNLLMEKKYLKALTLALRLNQPFRVLNIMKEVLDGEHGREDAAATLRKLRDDQMDVLLGFSTSWNTNSKNCHVAQYVVQNALTYYSPERLVKLPNIKSTIEALIPYTERHFLRMNKLQQQSTFVDYTWQTMKPVALALGEGESTNYSEETEMTHVGESEEESQSEDEGPGAIEKPQSEKRKMDVSDSGSSDDSDSDDSDNQENSGKEIHKPTPKIPEKSPKKRTEEVGNKDKSKFGTLKDDVASKHLNFNKNKDLSSNLLSKKRHKKGSKETDSDSSSDESSIPKALLRKKLSKTKFEKVDESDSSQSSDENDKTMRGAIVKPSKDSGVLKSPTASDKENDTLKAGDDAQDVPMVKPGTKSPSKSTPMTKGKFTPIAALKRRKSTKTPPSLSKRLKP